MYCNWKNRRRGNSVNVGFETDFNISLDLEKNRPMEFIHLTWVLDFNSFGSFIEMDIDTESFQKSYVSYIDSDSRRVIQIAFSIQLFLFGSISMIIGGTQILFRNLSKFSNIQKSFRASCSLSKIKPSGKFWVHGLVLEPRNRIDHLQFLDWDKHPLKLLFSKHFFISVIRVHRSRCWPMFTKKEL